MTLPNGITTRRDMSIGTLFLLEAATIGCLLLPGWWRLFALGPGLLHAALLGDLLRDFAYSTVPTHLTQGGGR